MEKLNRVLSILVGISLEKLDQVGVLLENDTAERAGKYGLISSYTEDCLFWKTQDSSAEN